MELTIYFGTLGRVPNLPRGARSSKLALPQRGSATQAVSFSRKGLWAGRVIGALTVLFLLFDSVIKLTRLPPAVEGTVQLGYPAGTVFGIGLVLLVCTVAYVVPRTSIVGAILLTGYLGGAVASNVRVGNPLFTHTLFPIYVAALVWGGLYLRSPRLRGLVRQIAIAD